MKAPDLKLTVYDKTLISGNSASTSKNEKSVAPYCNVAFTFINNALFT